MGHRERDGSRTGTGRQSGVPGATMESDDSRRSRYPDSHQVFVGNLPHNTTEMDLKNFFSRKVYVSVKSHPSGLCSWLVDFEPN